MINNIIKLCVLFSLITVPKLRAQKKNEKPNLIVIHTDEHNFRTLGCYRDLMTKEQAFVWGEGIEVKTPHLDRIANEGAICTKYYAANPVCAPSRASFITGLYPVATDVTKNGLILKDGLDTFASVLKNEGYATSYVGKWHLAGVDTPGFRPKNMFGFDDNRYTINQGHWKQIIEKNGELTVYKSGKSKFNEDNLETFATDFLISKSLQILKKDKDKPFCLMVSLPDPHGPNTVRPPYDTMYEHLEFKDPKTMNTGKENGPGWSFGKNQAEKLVQKEMQNIFGMVKCIDDNVGRILKFLDDENLAENTIIVFTSDHGDLMGEHHKHNKSSPYEASAKIPFIIRYPKEIKAGKVINTAYTTTDFVPTILGLMKAGSVKNVHGKDTSFDFIGKRKTVSNDRIVYLTTALSSWTSAVSNRYKYVLSPFDQPWLFDLKKDPDELINFYNDPKYSAVVKKFDRELNDQMKKYKDPAIEAWKDETARNATMKKIRIDEYRQIDKDGNKVLKK